MDVLKLGLGDFHFQVETTVIWKSRQNWDLDQPDTLKSAPYCSSSHMVFSIQIKCSHNS